MKIKEEERYDLTRKSVFELISVESSSKLVTLILTSDGNNALKLVFEELKVDFYTEFLRNDLFSLLAL
jgi:hypothetical protein